MKVLTLNQPWATLVALGEKKIETRSWDTKWRGWIAIHAAKGFPAECRNLCFIDPFKTILFKHLRQNAADNFYIEDVVEKHLPLGAIVAVAKIKDTMLTQRVSSVSLQEFAFGDYSPGRFAWEFEIVKPLTEPIPCKGALGLWTAKPELESQVLRSVPLTL